MDGYSYIQHILFLIKSNKTLLSVVCFLNSNRIYKSLPNSIFSVFTLRGQRLQLPVFYFFLFYGQF